MDDLEEDVVVPLVVISSEENLRIEEATGISSIFEGRREEEKEGLT